MLQLNAEYSPAGAAKDEGHVPPVLLRRYRQEGHKAERAQRSSIGAEHGHLSVGKQHVGTPCGIWHRAEPHALKITYWEGRLLFSYLTLPSRDSEAGRPAPRGNRIPLLTGDEISPFRRLLLRSSVSGARRRPTLSANLRPGVSSTDESPLPPRVSAMRDANG